MEDDLRKHEKRGSHRAERKTESRKNTREAVVAREDGGAGGGGGGSGKLGRTAGAAERRNISKHRRERSVGWQKTRQFEKKIQRPLGVARKTKSAP